MPLFMKQTRSTSPPRFTMPARAAARRGVMGSMAAKKKACVTNINKAAGKPRHLCSPEELSPSLCHGV